MKYKLNQNRGFSLIEMMIAMTIFTILSITATTTYIQAIKRQQNIRYMGAMAEEVNTIFNRISKDIRSAVSLENITGRDPSSGLKITKRDSQQGNTEYDIKYESENGGIKYTDGRILPPDNASILTLSKFQVSDLKFNVSSSSAPYVVMTYTAFYKDKYDNPLEATKVDISTTISMRSVIRNK